MHPYFLGLCADVALAAQRRGDRLDPASFDQSGELAGKQLDLARRLLAWVPAEVEYGILALSACRSFNCHTFSYLGQRLEFGHQRSDFDRLTAFSFISPTVSGSGGQAGAAEPTYSMHQLLRRALASARPDSVDRAHQVLEERYRELAAGGDFTAQLEQIYHAGQLYPARGVTGWVAVMDRCLNAGRYDRCRALITLLADLPAGEADRNRFTYPVARADIGLGRSQSRLSRPRQERDLGPYRLYGRPGRRRAGRYPLWGKEGGERLMTIKKAARECPRPGGRRLGGTRHRGGL
jgi:hypothetical protein